MTRGFIFTIDALLAIFLIIITVEFLLINFLQTQDREVLLSSLYAQTTDKVLADLYTHTPPSPPASFSKIVATCNFYLTYNPDNGPVGPPDLGSWQLYNECLESNS